MGVLDPTTTADAAYDTSRAAAAHRVKAIRGEVQFELATHRRTMQEARREYKRTKQAGLESHTAAVVGDQLRLPAAQLGP